MARFSLKENTTDILALMAPFQAFAFLMTLCFVEVPPRNEQLVSIMGTAVIINGMAAVYGFFFGDKKKRETIAESGTAIINSTETKEIK